MIKSKSTAVPNWVCNLRHLMEEKDLNPRSLSLKAGLNPTAVRDMLEGRSRFPRYDTAQALAKALDTTAAFLMSDQKTATTITEKGADFSHDIDLLTEIITRLEEISSEIGRKLPPRDFAAMAVTIYHRLQESEERKNKMNSISPQIHDLMDYEMLRQKRSRR